MYRRYLHWVYVTFKLRNTSASIAFIQKALFVIAKFAVVKGQLSYQ